MIQNLNPDQVLRDSIIGSNFIETESKGGIRDFKNLPVDTLKLLVEQNFAHEHDSCDYGPTINEYLAFTDDILKCNSDLIITFDGHAVDHWRSDYRVSVEAISIQGVIDLTIRRMFLHLVGNADDLKVTENLLYAWYD